MIGGISESELNNKDAHKQANIPMQPPKGRKDSNDFNSLLNRYD